ncbi:hypothetical protein RDWZM_003366 [Blomia tropicalis]|uniref:Calx-beta domain-containing protein n=1 Tax=Blomia tropicalis TaxID=40697 RepID=A0A9Q0MFA3_BLOTA|nr:hypothetical protein RDWZM_003366 [Blomia tropicalis]
MSSMMEKIINSTAQPSTEAHPLSLNPIGSLILSEMTNNLTTNVLNLTTNYSLISPSNTLPYSNVESASNLSISESQNPTPFATATNEPYIFHCKDGLMLPCWNSDGTMQTMFVHGFVYLLALIYMFVGVAMIADRFMASIEEITSQETDVIVRRSNGQKEIISVRIWNETVSNLTLMALGSSAPEIMLSVIEIYAQDFQAGDLGPGTIVGSAAFNMFIIIAVCVWAVPTDTLKKIKYLRVFIITLSFSVFAYVWMLVILVWSSPGVIEVWEGLLTFAFFFLTVLAAYIADRRLLIYKYLDKHYRVRSKVSQNSNGKIGGNFEEGTEMERMELTNETDSKENGIPSDTNDYTETGIYKNLKFIDATDEELDNLEEQRDHVIEILKDVQSRYPDANADEIQILARNEIAKLEPKSRAYYRIIAARRYYGSNNDIHLQKSFSSSENIELDGKISSMEDVQKGELLSTVDIMFEPVEYTVMEDAGSVQLTVTRVGDIASTICVCYQTESASAKAGSDFVEKFDSVTFGPGEAHKQFSIQIINDDEFENDEHFFVRLTEAKYLSAAVDSHTRPEIRIITSKAKINILDDDHSGIFGFLNNVFQIPETIGEYKLIVNRYCGARGRVSVPFKTIPATAKPGEDFQMAQGEIIFQNNETQKEIALQIINNVNYEKNSIFYVELYEPERLDEKMTKTDQGAPRLGDLTKCMIRIRESKDFKLIVDSLMRRRKMLGDRTSSWENQLIDAVTVHKLNSSSSIQYDDTESPKRVPDSSQEKKDDVEPKTAIDYFFHYLTLFWKVVFAIVPPPTIWNGWACFIVSIIGIGVLTSLINDLASHFGSTVHLKDSVTAISLVALGTSVPDTFASKIAAQNEKNADSSIGNVTGSNAVNVFLGIGLAWTVAAVYHAIKGTAGGFKVDPGSLSYSVTLYCICAFICALVLMIRRVYLGGELGGPMRWKIATVFIFVMLWLFYVIMSTLEAYGFVQGF